MFIIDRFEGEIAVIEYEKGKTFSLPRRLLPPGVKEGDVVRVTVTIDAEESARRKKMIADLMDDLFES